MSSCVVCDAPDTDDVVMTSMRCAGRKLFLKMCESCYKKSSVKFKVCNFCGTPEEDMHIVYNDYVYQRIRCCASCVTTIRNKLGLRNTREDFVEVDDE